jgi:hypothetical protein
MQAVDLQNALDLHQQAMDNAKISCGNGVCGALEQESGLSYALASQAGREEV